jgi:hypothetical protein
LNRFDPESVNLATLARHLEQTIGGFITGSVVGRTRIRDEVVRRLGVSQRQGEQIVDTLVARGFLVLQSKLDGLQYWEFGRSDVPEPS